MNNLFISYDLYQPGQDYGHIAEAIKQLGSWAKVQKSFWYVRSPFTAVQALDRIKLVIDKNDSVIVVDATHDNATWHNVDPKVGEHMRKQWSSSAANGLLAGIR